VVYFAVQLYSSPASNDSAVTFRIAPEKYPSGTLVDLNRADTTELKKIPGIGSGIARLIIGYRQRLGGFYNITQLQEIHLDTTQLQSWFSIDTRAIHLINLNRSSIERLRHHPSGLVVTPATKVESMVCNTTLTYSILLSEASRTVPFISIF
jgi:hypothetical protein